jgi:hypothetical protein
VCLSERQKERERMNRTFWRRSRGKEGALANSA